MSGFAHPADARQALCETLRDDIIGTSLAVAELVWAQDKQDLLDATPETVTREMCVRAQLSERTEAKFYRLLLAQMAELAFALRPNRPGADDPLFPAWRDLDEFAMRLREQGLPPAVGVLVSELGAPVEARAD